MGASGGTGRTMGGLTDGNGGATLEVEVIRVIGFASARGFDPAILGLTVDLRVDRGQGIASFAGLRCNQTDLLQY